MKMSSIIIALVIILLYSCKSYSDQKIQIRNQEVIDPFSAALDICITGKDELSYLVKLSYDDLLLDTLTLMSGLDKSFAKVQFDFSTLKEELPLLAYRIVINPQIGLHLSAASKKKKIVLDTTVFLKIRIPPISVASTIYGDNFSTTTLDKTKKYEQKIKENFADGDEDDIKRAAILTDMILTKSLHPTVRINERSVPILRATDKVKIKILTDTIYEYTVVGRYPSKKNKDYSDVDMDKQIKETIKNDLAELKSDWQGVKIGDRYVLEDEVEATYSGLVGLYVINIDKHGLYSYHEVANYLVDESAPMFNNYRYGRFNGDERFEGLLCLSTEHFYGFNPYKVPFTGRVYGDIKEIYVDGKKIPFAVGADLYFKKSIYLDGGYNRITVKLIDSKGNSAEYYIPITIESLDKSEINIDNDINIENN
jgi:hypothetical protein